MFYNITKGSSRQKKMNRKLLVYVLNETELTDFLGE